MSLDLSKLELIDEVVDMGDVEKWTEPSEFPPPPKGGVKYTYMVEQVRDVQVRTVQNFKVAEVTVDLSIVGGEADGRRVNFQRISSLRRKDGTSPLLDWFMSCGVSKSDATSARTVRDIAELASQIADEKRTCHGPLEWSAFSSEAYGRKLMELTGADTVDEAKSVATKEQRKEATNIAQLYRYYSKFPDDGFGGKLSNVQGPYGETVRAQGYVRLFTLS